MKKMSSDFKYVILAATIAALVLAWSGAKDIKETLYRLLGWVLVFLLVLVVTGEYFDKNDDD